MIAPSVLINTIFVEFAVWPTKLFHDSLVTQRSAGNTVALSVAMLATKCVMTFETLCHLVVTAVPNGRLLLCRLCRLRGRGRAGSATNLPVPVWQSKGKTQALSSVSLPAPMQKRRKSQAQGPQVTQLPQSADSLEDPVPRRKAATEITRCVACNKSVRCASPRQVNQQFAMADGFDSRCVSCCECWRGIL